MDIEQEGIKEEDRHSEQREINSQQRDVSDVGKGKKLGLYGCAFIILAIVIFFIVLIYTGFYAPFQGSEGVGP
jgi:hypothetical protein